MTAVSEAYLPAWPRPHCEPPSPNCRIVRDDHGVGILMEKRRDGRSGIGMRASRQQEYAEGSQDGHQRSMTLRDIFRWRGRLTTPRAETLLPRLDISRLPNYGGLESSTDARCRRGLNTRIAGATKDHASGGVYVRGVEAANCSEEARRSDAIRPDRTAQSHIHLATLVAVRTGTETNTLSP